MVVLILLGGRVEPLWRWCTGAARRSSRCSGRTGAIEKPQLPATTDVTPCQHDGVRAGSQNTWAS